MRAHPDNIAVAQRPLLLKLCDLSPPQLITCRPYLPSKMRGVDNAGEESSRGRSGASVQ